MTRPTEITTERLLLRPFRLSDVDDVLAYASDPEWAAFLSPAIRPRESRIYRRAGGGGTRGDREAEFAVVSDGRVVGLISLTVDLEDQTAELGYDIAREMWGRGIATEAAAAVLRLGLSRIQASEGLRHGRLAKTRAPTG